MSVVKIETLLNMTWLSLKTIFVAVIGSLFKLKYNEVRKPLKSYLCRESKVEDNEFKESITETGEESSRRTKC